VHTAICLKYRVGATVAQAGSGKETPISKNTISKHKASISFTILKGPFVDIDKSLISRYKDIEVLIFDINVSLISYCVDIEVPAINIEDYSIQYWIEIEC
jgi:hypothetical protein